MASRRIPSDHEGGSIVEAPSTIADFRRWLRAEIAELDETCPQENHFWEAADTIRESRRIALSLDQPDIAKMCRIGNRPLALPAAQEILSACLATLRTKNRAAPRRDMLTPPEVGRRYGVSPDTVRAWIASGELRAMNVGKGKRPRYRVPADALKELDAKRLPKVVPVSPVQCRRRAKPTGLLVTRFSSGH
jgi:excisionase family DNA binding protein